MTIKKDLPIAIGMLVAAFVIVQVLVTVLETMARRG